MILARILLEIKRVFGWQIIEREFESWQEIKLLEKQGECEQGKYLSILLFSYFFRCFGRT